MDKQKILLILFLFSSFSFLAVVEESGDYGMEQKDSFLNSTMYQLRRRCRSICTKKTVYKRVPILNWLPRYNGHDALGDLVAGVTVGLTVIPQSLAYANVAGLPPQVSIILNNDS